MKTQLFALILAVGMAVAANAGQSYAQGLPSIQVDVPFEFTANNKKLPAGSYRLGSVTDNRIVWKLVADSGDSGLFLVANTLSGVRHADNLRLTFHRYGMQHFLVGFKTPSYEVTLPSSGLEKNLRQVRNGIGGYDVVQIYARKFGNGPADAVSSR